MWRVTPAAAMMETLYTTMGASIAELSDALLIELRFRWR